MCVFVCVCVYVSESARDEDSGRDGGEGGAPSGVCVLENNSRGHKVEAEPRVFECDNAYLHGWLQLRP